MFQKAMKNLRGDAVIARHGCIRASGALFLHRTREELRSSPSI